jgi:uncharacterized protein YjbI with pentapeptide repeats
MSQTAPANSSFVCASRAPDARRACLGREYNKTGYCVFHYPNKEKSADFKEALRGRLEEENFNFQGVWFPDEVRFPKGFTFGSQADFSHANFDERADFTEAVFVRQANFYFANFSARANFDNATFGNHKEFGGRANFDSVTFKARTSFHSAVFKDDTRFFSATFHDRANFDYARFERRANFRLTNFKDSASFHGANDIEVFGAQSWLDFREVKIEKPELISFHTLALRPYWFVDSNPSRFVMTNVEWHSGTPGQGISIGPEIDALAKKRRGIESPDRLLAIACWNLAVNAEENHRYEEASSFRYMAMDARRLTTFRRTRKQWDRFIRSLKGRNLPGSMIKRRSRLLCKSAWLLCKSACETLNLRCLYWAASGYGEKTVQALLMLIGLLVVCAVLNAFVMRDKAGARLTLPHAVSYSAGVMMLQKPEPVPATTAAQSLVLLETFLGPAQAALLLLAIRRKFMR